MVARVHTRRRDDDAADDANANADADAQANGTQENDDDAQDDSADAHDNAAPQVLPPLFRSHSFYLARTLSPQRRRELGAQIEALDGRLVPRMAHGAIEIVEREHLRPGTHWVAADYVTTAAATGALPPIHDHMAPPPQHDAVPRRLRRKAYTAAEDAQMLAYLQREWPEHYRHGRAPLRLWEQAEKKGITTHSSQSMLEHYRKKLAVLSEHERATLLAKHGQRCPTPTTVAVVAEGVADDDATTTTPPMKRERVVTEARTTESDEEIQGRVRKKRTTRPAPAAAAAGASGAAATPTTRVTPAADTASKPRSAPQASPMSSAPPPSAAGRATSSPSRPRPGPTVTTTPPPTTAPRAPLPAPSPLGPRAAATHERRPQGQRVDEDDDNEDEEEKKSEESEAPGRSGEVFRGFWGRVVRDPAQRRQLERFFAPPPSTPPPSSPPSRPAPPTPAVESTPLAKRSRRLSREGAPATPEGRRERALAALAQELASPGTSATSKRLRPKHGPTRRPPAAPTPTTTASPSTSNMRSRSAPATEAETDGILRRLQFATAHDVNAVCSALYWASGDAEVARAFLLGGTPRELWSPADDQPLGPFMRADVTLAALAEAKREGAFRAMRVDRSPDAILRRIRFLL